MIFIANALPLNGGSTFLIRVCRELNKRGVKASVLVLFDNVDQLILNELQECACIVFLSDFLRCSPKTFHKNQLSTFSPLNYKKLFEYFDEYDNSLHVMGVFGLLFVERLKKYKTNILKATVGIYHQNEFAFKNVDYYFANQSKKIFKSLNERQIIFYNEISRDGYERFFDKDFSNSPVLPIGITLPDQGGVGSLVSSRIVSIGQLYNFKTYNKHVINCMPGLLKVNGNITYEIYGDGAERKALEDLASSLGLLDSSVFFMGEIAYKEIPIVLSDAAVFVGSGTAIIEASALGIPSIIGVESIKLPLTYGYFSDAIGFSYHEFNPRRKTLPLEDVILSVLEDCDKWHAQSLACAEKAQEFSIGKTIDGLLGVYSSEIQSESKSGAGYSNLYSLLSFMVCAIFEKLRVNTAFSNRRDQGTFF